MAKLNNVLNNLDVTRYRKAMKALPSLLNVTRGTFDKYRKGTSDITLRNAGIVVEYLKSIGIDTVITDLLEETPLRESTPGMSPQRTYKDSPQGGISAGKYTKNIPK